MLGILRGSRDEPSLAPQPGLSDLPALVDQMRTAGLPVSLEIRGERSLPAGIGLTVYRIVQEGLTNVAKHARGANASVTVALSERSVLVEVADDGVGDLPGPVGGHGLVGMGERVAVYGGKLTAEHRDGRGFVVQAELPVEQARALP